MCAVRKSTGRSIGRGDVCESGSCHSVLGTKFAVAFGSVPGIMGQTTGLCCVALSGAFNGRPVSRIDQASRHLEVR
jgi:hypothetical protein